MSTAATTTDVIAQALVIDENVLPAWARVNAPDMGFPARPPGQLSLSCGRAVQQPGPKNWRGDKANASCDQEALAHRARRNRTARPGNYPAATE